jgi:hypothetical protein
MVPVENNIMVKHTNEETAIIKKPSKKERLLAKRAQREQVLDVGMDLPVTLECPECHIQQVMTLEEYFGKINYGSPFRKVLRCETCENQPPLMFYKVKKAQIAAAGLNYERMKQGISKPEMLDKLEKIDQIRDAANKLTGKHPKGFDELVDNNDNNE